MGEKDRFVLTDFFYRNVPLQKQALQELYPAVPEGGGLTRWWI